ncbi:unnamed protein product [Dicrocoelium dendriticum]|nr:unnamed protein product [Dicrocoelium dendriticum]
MVADSEQHRRVGLLSPAVSEHPISRLLVGPPLFISWLLLTRYLLCRIDLNQGGMVTGFFYNLLLLYLPLVGLFVYHRTRLLQILNVSSSLHSQRSPLSQLILTSICDFFEIWAKVVRINHRLARTCSDQHSFPNTLSQHFRSFFYDGGE